MYVDSLGIPWTVNGNSETETLPYSIISTHDVHSPPQAYNLTDVIPVPTFPNDTNAENDILLYYWFTIFYCVEHNVNI
jgi:hypothetical protein